MSHHRTPSTSSTVSSPSSTTSSSSSTTFATPPPAPFTSDIWAPTNDDAVRPLTRWLSTPFPEHPEKDHREKNEAWWLWFEPEQQPQAEAQHYQPPSPPQPQAFYPQQAIQHQAVFYPQAAFQHQPAFYHQQHACPTQPAHAHRPTHTQGHKKRTLRRKPNQPTHRRAATNANLNPNAPIYHPAHVHPHAYVHPVVLAGAWFSGPRRF